MGHRLERGCCFRINTEGKSEVRWSVVGFLRSLGQVGLVSLSTILESPPLLTIYTTRKGKKRPTWGCGRSKRFLCNISTFGPERNFNMPEDGEFYGKHGNCSFFALDLY